MNLKKALACVLESKIWILHPKFKKMLLLQRIPQCDAINMQIYSEFHAHNIAEQEASWRQKYTKQPINCIKQRLPVVVR